LGTIQTLGLSREGKVKEERKKVVVADGFVLLSCQLSVAGGQKGTVTKSWN